MLSDDCAEFLLELLGVRLSEIETLWFFSDWSDCDPRTFAKRLEDLFLSRLLCGEAAARSGYERVALAFFDVEPSMMWAEFERGVR